MNNGQRILAYLIAGRTIVHNWLAFQREVVSLNLQIAYYWTLIRFKPVFWRLQWARWRGYRNRCYVKRKFGVSDAEARQLINDTIRGQR